MSDKFTPALPDEQVLDQILTAFDKLPAAKWAWGGSFQSLHLEAQQSGRPTIFSVSSRKAEFLFRTPEGVMEGEREILARQGYDPDKSIDRLDNPAAIALASAWLVPHLIRENRKLREAGQWVPITDWEKTHHQEVVLLYKLHKGWISKEAYWDGFAEKWRNAVSHNFIEGELHFVTAKPQLPNFPSAE